MYHVRCLRKLCVQNNIICLFYNSVISSVLAYAISCFYGACYDQLKNDLCKFPKKMRKLIDPATTYSKRCISIVTSIVIDPTHPLYHYFTLLPHGRLT